MWTSACFFSTVGASLTGLEETFKRDEKNEAGGASNLKKSLPVIDEKTVWLWFVLAVKGIQSKALSLEIKEINEHHSLSSLKPRSKTEILQNVKYAENVNKIIIPVLVQLN